MPVNLRCLVVDDEPLARRILVKYIADVPRLALAAECGDARTAAACLRKHTIDVMFLDIRMPGLDGLEFLRTLSSPVRVVLTTAHSEYALEGYEHAVVDYLLKPIAFERFLKAVDRLGGGAPATSGARAEQTPDHIFLRADRVDHKIRFDRIRFLEAYGNFVKVHLDRGTILVAGTLTALDRALPADRFIRVHRSYIAALDRVDSRARATLRIGDADIPIGGSYRRDVARRLGGRR